MTKRARLFPALGLTALVTFVAVALVLGTEPTWFKNGLRAFQMWREGWSIVKQGDFVPITYRRTGDGYQHPKEYISSLNVLDLNTGAILYFSGPEQVSRLDLSVNGYGKEPRNYAKILTPTGSFLLLPIEKGSDSNGIYFVQIPAVHPVDTDHLDLQIVTEGFAQTMVRLDPPKSMEAVEQKAEPITQVKDQGITISGSAFSALKKGEPRPTALGYRIKWSPLPEGLTWRIFAYTNVLQPFLKSGTEIKSRGYIRSDYPERQTLGLIESIPYASDVKMVAAKGRIDGHDVITESVDFGTMPLITHAKQNATYGNDFYYLDFSKPIQRTLPSGLKLTLLPLRSHDGLNTSYGGTSLYIRLKAEPDTISAGVQAKPALNEPVIVEAKLLGVDTSPQQVEPDPNPLKVSNVQMRFWTPPASMRLSLKFEVKRILLRRRVPFEFRLPVDHSKPIKSQVGGPYLHGGEECID